jgi:hypothetical protein
MFQRQQSLRPDDWQKADDWHVAHDWVLQHRGRCILSSTKSRITVSGAHRKVKSCEMNIPRRILVNNPGEPKFWPTCHRAKSIVLYSWNTLWNILWHKKLTDASTEVTERRRELVERLSNEHGQVWSVWSAAGHNMGTMGNTASFWEETIYNHIQSYNIYYILYYIYNIYDIYIIFMIYFNTHFRWIFLRDNSTTAQLFSLCRNPQRWALCTVRVSQSTEPQLEQKNCWNDTLW